jgi:hypothetical protein
MSDNFNPIFIHVDGSFGEFKYVVGMNINRPTIVHVSTTVRIIQMMNKNVFMLFYLVPRRGLEPLHLAAYAPQAQMSTSFNTRAKYYFSLFL